MDCEKLKCFYGCGKSFSAAEIKNHHLNECSFKFDERDAPSECNSDSKGLEELIFKRCPKCLRYVEKSRFQSHLREHDATSKSCQYCGKEIPFTTYKRHVDICKETSVNLKKSDKNEFTIAMELKVQRLEEENDLIKEKLKKFELVLTKNNQALSIKKEDIFTLENKMTSVESINKTIASEINELKKQKQVLENEQHALKEEVQRVNAKNVENIKTSSTIKEELLNLKKSFEEKVQQFPPHNNFPQMPNIPHPQIYQRFPLQMPVCQPRFMLNPTQQNAPQHIFASNFYSTPTALNPGMNLKKSDSNEIVMEHKLLRLEKESDLMKKKFKEIELVLAENNQLLFVKNEDTLKNKISVQYMNETLASEINELNKQKQVLENEVHVLKQEMQKVNAKNLEIIDANSALEKEFLNLKKSFEEKVKYLTDSKELATELGMKAPIIGGKTKEFSTRKQRRSSQQSFYLGDANAQEQKQMLGERLFPIIHLWYPAFAGKITGMLLEIDYPELWYMLEHKESLRSKVEEAMAVLKAHYIKESLGAVKSMKKQ